MTTASGAVEKYSNGDLFKVDDMLPHVKYQSFVVSGRDLTEYTTRSVISPVELSAYMTVVYFVRRNLTIPTPNLE